MLSLLRSTYLLFCMHLGAVLRSRRALVGLVLAAFPPLIAWLALRFGPDVTSVELLTGISLLSLQVVVPLVALVAGSAVVTEEIENRTITYIFSRPVSRVGLLFGRWFATLVLVSALIAGSAGAALLVARSAGGDLPQDMAARYLGSSLAGGAVYSLLFAVLGVFLKRPMIVGLGYCFAFEGFIANVPGSSQSLSIQYYLRSILVDPELRTWSRFNELGIDQVGLPGPALTTLATLAAVAAIVGAVGIRRRQFVLTS